MQPIDAEELLKTLIGEDISDKDGMTELLGLLEYLPLAISQAASFIAENSTSISQYYQMYNESEASSIELLSEDFEDLARDSESRNPVATTWMISFDHIRKSDLLAANLLSFMACLERQVIPKALLPSAGGPVRLSNALGLLKAYSLITASQKDQIFNMHRLVHLATRNWLRLSGKFDEWAKSCLALVLEEFPSGEHGTLDTCDSYFPHALAVLGYEQLSPASDTSRAHLAYKISRYLENRGRYDAAETLAEQALRWRDKVLGKEHPSTLTSMDNLGVVLWRQGRYDEAEEMHRRVLELKEKVLGKEHPSTLTSMDNLTRMLERQGRYDEAEEHPPTPGC